MQKRECERPERGAAQPAAPTCAGRGVPSWEHRPGVRVLLFQLTCQVPVSTLLLIWKNFPLALGQWWFRVPRSPRAALEVGDAGGSLRCRSCISGVLGPNRAPSGRHAGNRSELRLRVPCSLPSFAQCDYSLPRPLEIPGLEGRRGDFG